MDTSIPEPNKTDTNPEPTKPKSILKWIILILILLIVCGAGIYIYKKLSPQEQKPEKPIPTETPLAEETKEEKPLPLATPETPTVSNVTVLDYKVSDKLVLASYYPWYGYKNANWDNDPESPIADHPLVGAYRSADPETIDYQLSLAQDTGIDAFVASWGGVGSTQDTIIKQMLSQINSSTRYPNFKVGIMFESIANLGSAFYESAAGQNKSKTDSNQQTGQKVSNATPGIINELTYILREYKNNPAFLRIDGKPLIYIYTPNILPMADWRQIIDAVTAAEGPAIYVASPNDWDFEWEWLSVFDTISPYIDRYVADEQVSANYNRLIQTVRPQGKPVIATIIGGGGYVNKRGFSIDRSQGKYIKKRNEMAKRAGVDWLYLTSWNEWFEGNQIEPSREYGFDGIKYMREASAEFKGGTLNPLAGASISLQNNEIINNGGQNVYAVACKSGGTVSSYLSYVLHPGERTVLGTTCGEIAATLANGNTVTTR